MNPIDFRKYLVGDEAPLEAAKSIRTLKSSVTALAKGVEADGARIEAGLKRVKDAAAEISQKLPRLQFANEDDRKALIALGASLDALRKQGQELKRDEEARARTQKQLAESTSFYTKELKEQRAALKAAYESGNLEGFKTAAKNIQALTQEANILNKAVRGTASTFTAAQGSYDAANQRLQALRAELRALEGGLSGTNPRAAELTTEIQQLDTQLKAADRGMGQYYRNVGNYTQSILEAVKALEEEKRVLLQASAAQRAQAQSTNLSAEQQDQLQKEIRETDAALDQVNGKLRGYGVETEEAGKKTGGLGGFLKDNAKLFLTGFIGLSAVTSAFGQGVEAVNEFERAQSSLSAITGATGEDLEFFAQEAERIGPKMGKSAAETLKAFELIGSAQPELLKSKEALAQVTEQALLLATASGDDLPAAAAALTGVMNQFQAPAAEAARYVNALAAGAKEGAATIPQTAESLKSFGVNAARANISVEQSVALIQTLAERSIKGEQAGTQLRNILAKLASGAKDTNPEVVGLSTALDNLGKKNLSTAQLTKLFGLENANSAAILIDSREKVKGLTTALTGTQEAALQASRQLNNAAASGAQLAATAGNAATAFLRKFSPAVRLVFSGLTELIQKIAGTNKSFQQTVKEQAAVIEANQNQARSAQGLLNRYEELTAKGLKPTAAEKKELDVITLKLTQSLGDSVASIDKETGALVLNKEAVKEAIKQRLLLANQTASTLALEANAALTRRKDADLKTKEFQGKLATQRLVLEQEGVQTAQEAQTIIDSYIRNGGRVTGYTKTAVDASEQYLFLQRDLTASIERSRVASDEYAKAIAALNKLGFSAADIAKLFAGNVDESAKALSSQGDAAAGAVVDLQANSKAQAELQRTILEGQLSAQERLIASTKEYQEQQGKLFEDDQLNRKAYAENVAGTQQVIIDAERKAAALRIAIAVQSQTERDAQARKDLAATKRRRGVTDAEVVDSERALNAKLKTSAETLKQDIIKINDDLAKALKSEPLEFKVGQIDSKRFRETYQRVTYTFKDGTQQVVDYYKGIDDGLDEINRKALQRMQDDTERRKAQYEIDAENKRKYEERKREIEQETIQQGVALFEQATAAAFQIRADQLQREQDLLRHKYDEDLEAAGTNEALKAQIQDDYRRKELALRRQQAKLDKQQAEFNIVMNTAQAVAAVLSRGGGTYYADFGAAAAILTGLVIAQGAVQLAAVASRPLPAFFKGTDNAPEGPALVAEKGPELIERRAGGFEYVAQQGIIYLNAGDKVYTAEKTSNMLAEAAIKSDELRAGPMATQQSFYASSAALTNRRTVVVTPSNDKALEVLGDRITKAVERSAAQTAHEIMRRRLVMGNASLDEAIHARMRSLGR